MMLLLSGALAGTPVFYGITSLNAKIPNHSPADWVALLEREQQQSKLTFEWVEPGSTQRVPVGPKGKPLSEMSRLGWAGYYLAIAGALDVGHEYDLVLASDQGPTAVTIWFESRKHVVVSVGATLDQPPEGPAPTDLVQRHGLAGYEERGAAFEPRVRGVIDEALALLAPKEHAVLKDVTLVRERKTVRAGQGLWINAAELVNGTGTAELMLYDDFLRPALRFTGPTSAPRHSAYFTLLHEVAHAIDTAPRRDRWRQAQAAIDAFNEKSKRYNEAVARAQTTGVTPDEAAALNAEGAALLKDRDAVEKLNRELEARHPRVSDDFRKRFGGITVYGASDDGEAFAEAFALHHLDPEALRRVSPQAADWFLARGHLALL